MRPILLLILILVSFSFEAESHSGDSLKRYEFNYSSMGSLFRIICYADDENKVHELSLNAFARIDSMNKIMSDYLSDSELNRLCNTSGKNINQPVSYDLFDIIRRSNQWSVSSKGAFDITVGVYTQLWRRAGRKGELPDPDKLKNASEKVGYGFIHMDSANQSIQLTKKGMQLDLGGIAKGYAIDEAFRIFREGGLSMVLVDGAGDIRVGDPPPGENGWKIMVETLEKGRKMIEVSNKSVATSGDLYRFVEIDNERYSHIIDPQTGYGIKIPRTVTVEAETATDADAMASIISVLGPDAGFELLGQYENMKCVIIQNINGKIEKWESGRLNYVN